MSTCVIALALLLDASGSMPQPQWTTLLHGHAAAFEAVEVHRAIRTSGPIAVRAWQFSETMRPLTPWRVLGAEADARAYAQELRAAERTLSANTAIGDAMLMALTDFSASPCPDAERVIDVATDGHENAGTPAAKARDAAIAAEVRVNVLAIETAEGDPEPFARENIVTPDGFVLRVTNWQDVPRAIVRKISLELAGATNGQ